MSPWENAPRARRLARLARLGRAGPAHPAPAPAGGRGVPALGGPPLRDGRPAGHAAAPGGPAARRASTCRGPAWRRSSRPAAPSPSCVDALHHGSSPDDPTPAADPDSRRSRSSRWGSSPSSSGCWRMIGALLYWGREANREYDALEPPAALPAIGARGPARPASTSRDRRSGRCSPRSRPRPCSSASSSTRSSSSPASS